MKSKAILLGSMKDTSFIAHSSDVICSMNYVSGKVTVTISGNSFKTNDLEKDSLLSSLYENEIKIEFNAGSIFDINNDAYESSFKKTAGEVDIGEESFVEPIEYKIGYAPLSLTQYRPNSTKKKNLEFP